MTDVVDRAIQRFEVRARRIVDSDAGQAGIAGAIIGLAVGAIAEHSGVDPLGIDKTGELKRHAARIASKASFAVARVSSALDPGNPLASTAVGFEFGNELANPWRGRQAPISTRDQESKVFPRPNEPGEFPKVDIADRYYLIVKKEVPDTDGTDHKYRVLGDEMNRLVVEGSHDPLVKQTAAQITKGLSSAQQKAAAIHVWIQKNILYAYDEDSPYLEMHPEEIQPEWNGALEVFAQPAITLKNRVGDCDDRVVLSAALLRAAGVYSFARLMSQGHPNLYSHVYGVVPLEDGTPFVTDTTPVRDGSEWAFFPPGWEAADAVSHMDILFQALPGQAS